MIKKLKIKLIEDFFLETVAIAVMFFIFAGPVLASEITPDKVIKLVNIAREKEGLSPLAQSEALMKVASDKLKDMINNHYFAHTSPSGKNPWYWFSKENYDYKYAGENLAINFTSAEEQQAAWMKSLAHKKNILNPNYQEIGVAFGAGEINGEPSLITVQEFGVQALLAGASKEGENFLIQKSADFLRDGSQILPQVLSSKSETPKEAELKSQSFPKADISKILPGASNILSLISVFLFLSSLALLPISFLAMACDRIYILYETRKHVRHAQYSPYMARMHNILR